jgi:hypothetical protein
MDLTEFYWASEAAQVISEQSGCHVNPDYLRKLAQQGKLHPIPVNGRNLYRRVEVENVRIRGRSGKSGSASACATG